MPLASVPRGTIPAAGQMAAPALARAARTVGVPEQALSDVPPASFAVKPKGGNWLAGDVDRRSGEDPTIGISGNPERVRDIFRVRTLGDDPSARLRELEKYYAEYEARGLPLDPAVFLRERSRLESDIAINQWIGTKLAKYVRDEMATPDDPLRVLADRGVSHIALQERRGNRLSLDDLRKERREAGFPEEGVATTPAGRAWEQMTDPLITKLSAGDLLRRLGDTPYLQRVEGQNPWIRKVPPETDIYGVSSAGVVYDLGFNHLIDELRNAMNPNSGLPRDLLIDPKKIDKISVPQAVERVSKINAWRVEEAARAEKAGMMENLKANPRMADETLQFSFVNKPGGAWVDIPETTDTKGMKLCTSIGKAGGWCTQSGSTAEIYGSGNNRLAALIDAEGRPHAQAMIAEAKVKGDAPDIKELKPVGNTFDSARAKEYMSRDPEYKQKVTQSVLKFLNSGNWDNVADLRLYDIVDIRSVPEGLVSFIERAYGTRNLDDTARIMREVYRPAMENALRTSPRFVTREQFNEVLASQNLLKGYSQGGSVLRPGEGLSEPGLFNLSWYSSQVAKEMFPDREQNPQRDAARHMLASALAAKKTSPRIAEFLGKAYEFKESPALTAGHWLGTSEPRSDYRTDIHNNRLGIDLSRRAKSLRELLDMIEAEARRGTPKREPGRASLEVDVGNDYAHGGPVNKHTAFIKAKA